MKYTLVSKYIPTLALALAVGFGAFASAAQAGDRTDWSKGVAQSTAIGQMTFDRSAVGVPQVGLVYGNHNGRHGFAVGTGVALDERVFIRGTYATSGGRSHTFGVGATFSLQ